MKFRPAAAIALSFLLMLLFSTLSTTSSFENKSHIHENRTLKQKWKTFFRSLVGVHNARITQTSLLPQRNNNILSLVIHEFLTCKDIIVLRQTCYDFQYLLHPNDAHMVTFCISKTMTDTNIIWEDLKYFMKQNYYSAFYEMKMFNIKENEYAVLTRVPEEKYIVWNNKSIPYYKMLLDETTQYTPLHNYHEKHFQTMKFFNKYGTAWATITKDGHVITGGTDIFGGDSSIVQSQLKNVKKIFFTNFAFAALLYNGTVVAWGDGKWGGKIPDEIQTQLINVKMIISNHGAFAALLNNGTVVTWGYGNWGGKITDEIQIQLINVKKIFSNYSAFVALLNNGLVVAWGLQNKMIKNVKMIFSTFAAFAALLNDGTVVAWGNKRYGGKIPDEIQTQLIDVKQIMPTKNNFTALCKNGKILKWGRHN